MIGIIAVVSLMSNLASQFVTAWKTFSNTWSREKSRPNQFKLRISYLELIIKVAVTKPGAALPAERIRSLSEAHSEGIYTTWVSFEPVFNPDAVYRLIEKTHEYVNLYKVGKLNYHKRAKEINWPGFRHKVSALLDSLGKDYLIKKDLKEA